MLKVSRLSLLWVFFVLFCFETGDVLAGEDVGAKTAKLCREEELLGSKPGERFWFEPQHPWTSFCSKSVLQEKRAFTENPFVLDAG